MIPMLFNIYHYEAGQWVFKIKFSFQKYFSNVITVLITTKLYKPSLNLIKNTHL